MSIQMNREHVKEVFRIYTDHYDSTDEKVRLKIDHTYRVAELCERIALSAGLREEADLAWLTGMLHDIGRFEQLRRFGTFMDAESVDHAALGGDILFREGMIRKFLSDDREDSLIETAVRVHSAYRIPEGLDGRTRKLCAILRDADKIDILKVNVDFPLEEIYNVSTQELRSCQASPEVMDAFYEEHAVLRSLKRTAADHLIGHVSLVYELVYPVSLRIVREQGYLEKMLSFASDNPVTREQFAAVRAHMGDWLAKNERRRNGD